MPNKFKNPYLMHSWGKTPEQKARERAYNHKYYEEHKEKFLKKAHSLENQTVKPYMTRAQQAVTGAREAVRSAGNRAVTNATGALLDNDLFKKTLVKAGHNTSELGKLHKRSRQASRAAGTAANEAAKAAQYPTPGRRAMTRAKYNVESAIGEASNYVRNLMGYNGPHQGKRVNLKDYDRKDWRSVSRLQEANDRVNRLNAEMRRGEPASRSTENIRAMSRARAEQRRAMNQRAASGAAYNEAAKAQMLATKGYDSRYDTKLGRDIQNTMSKFRKYTKKRSKR